MILNRMMDVEGNLRIVESHIGDDKKKWDMKAVSYAMPWLQIEKMNFFIKKSIRNNIYMVQAKIFGTFREIFNAISKHF